MYKYIMRAVTLLTMVMGSVALVQLSVRLLEDGYLLLAGLFVGVLGILLYKGEQIYSEVR